MLTVQKQKLLTALRAAIGSTNSALLMAKEAPDNVKQELVAALAYAESAQAHATAIVPEDAAAPRSLTAHDIAERERKIKQNNAR